ncbi:CWF19-like protein 2 homolog [Cydia pomonella]|uniref:CWF19-like protein 2 homolog n=1 Tax=Cydia pomonella TaxID=82600 RepID=UPI002ADE7A21|nr:CWF19-like protein 2 homolog [Cydia pomonella]
MKEKRKKDKHKKKSKHKDKRERKRHSSTSSSSSGEDEWVEKQPAPNQSTGEREDWMAMTGMMKTYTKDDIRKPKQEEKKHIDSYNPATSSRELNPYWKDGGGGLPQTPESFRKSRQFLKPESTDLYSRSSSSKESYTDTDYKRKSCSYSSSYSHKSGGWRKESKRDEHRDSKEENRSSSRDESRRDSEDYYRKGSRDDYRRDSRDDNKRDSRDDYRKESRDGHKKDSMHRRNDNSCNERENKIRDFRDQSPENKDKESNPVELKQDSKQDSLYLSDEKLNKLAAKIVKAEIIGNTILVTELKAKLEAAREYRKQNPDAGKEEEEDDRVMLMSTNSMGNSRPLTKGSSGDPRSKGGKRKAETHVSGERTKYFGNDDKYNLKQMFQEEKYGDNYNEDAELAKIASKHKNPNDDLEDIFTDEISKNRSEARETEREKQRAIQMHSKMERSLEGCEYCLDSKNMLKHLMVSCGTKVYLALPAKKSLVKGQCIITTIQHSTCVTAVDEDVWEEIMNYRQALTKFFNSQDKDVVFFETATRLHKFPHLVINCIPLPRDVGDMASIYFKKALLECEAEWSVNKKVVELKGKNIRKGVPKGLPYFWVDFAMDPGFAHVIEDQQLFPRNFAEEIIGGILDLDHYLWKNPKREPSNEQRQKVLEFSRDWKPFDIVSKNKV